MNQSSFMFGMLFLSFVLFITAKGELPTYLSLLTGSGQTDAQVYPGSSSSAPSTDTQKNYSGIPGFFGIPNPKNSLNPFTLFGLF